MQTARTAKKEVSFVSLSTLGFLTIFFGEIYDFAIFDDIDRRAGLEPYFQRPF